MYTEKDLREAFKAGYKYAQDLEIGLVNTPNEDIYIQSINTEEMITIKFHVVRNSKTTEYQTTQPTKIECFEKIQEIYNKGSYTITSLYLDNMTEDEEFLQWRKTLTTADYYRLGGL